MDIKSRRLLRKQAYAILESHQNFSRYLRLIDLAFDQDEDTSNISRRHNTVFLLLDIFQGYAEQYLDENKLLIPQFISLLNSLLDELESQDD